MKENIKRKLSAPDAKKCIYHNLDTYERLFYDNYNRWNDKDLSLSDIRKDFKERIFPLAEKNGDLVYPKSIDDLYIDQAGMQTYSFNSGNISSCFTPYGIKNIDAYFTNRIRNIDSQDDAYSVEKEIYLCPHLHILIKKDLLNNVRTMLDTVVS